MNFASARSRVLERSPVLGEILARDGNVPLVEYLSGHFKPSTVPLDHRKPLSDVVGAMVGDLIGRGHADSAAAEFVDTYAVSTADHHGPLDHPFFVGSNLAAAYALKAHGKQYSFVFACGGISMSNSSLPRAVSYHSADGAAHRILFAPWKDRRHPVFGYPAYDRVRMDAARHVLADDAISREIATSVVPIFSEKAVYDHAYYADQMSAANHRLWQKMPGLENMHVVYLQFEDVVHRLLLGYHLPRETIISRFLTEGSHLDAYERHFKGIRGAFDEGRGTFLFWGLLHGQRVQLIRDGMRLVSTDGSFVLQLTREHISDAISEKKIFPSLSLLFFVALHHGLTCFGGFSQVTYLGHMKDAYARCLQSVQSDDAGSSAFLGVRTDLLCGDFLFTYIDTSRGSVAATALDIIARQPSAEKIAALLDACTLEVALDQMMPELHKIFFGTRSEIPEFPHGTL